MAKRIQGNYIGEVPMFLTMDAGLDSAYQKKKKKKKKKLFLEFSI